MRRRIAILLLGLLVPNAVQGATYIVHPDGSGDFPTIQEALNTAASGDTILLGDGVFTGTGNRNLNYLAKTLVVQSQSGDPSACTIDCQGLGRGVTFVSVSSRLAKLAGVTITNGVGDGAAIYCEHSSPTIENCVLEGNGTSDRGGGVHCRLSSFPLLSGCLITDNHAQAGGGVYCYSAGAELSGTTVTGNTSLGNGAGLWMNVTATITMSDSWVTENEAGGMGGGIWCSGTVFTPSTLTVANSVVAGNDATQGGGLLCIGMAPFIVGTAFTGNRASASDGGAAMCFDSELTFEQCTFAGNASAGNGGAVALNGATASFDHTILRADCASLAGAEVYLIDVGDGAIFTCSLIAPGGVEGPGSVAIGPDCIDADPLFCGPELCAAAPTVGGEYTLDALSPAAPPTSAVCGLIGAYDVACDITSVGEEVAASAGFACRAIPNPARGATRITFRGSSPGTIATVDLYDVQGRLVRVWHQRLAGEGSGAVEWDGAGEDGTAAPAGIYFVRVRIGSQETRGRFTLLR